MDLDHSNTSSSLLHSITVSEIGISVLWTGDSVGHDVTDDSTTALVSALRRVEEFIDVFVSYSFNAEEFCVCVCVSVCCSDVKVSVLTDLFCLFFFIPLSDLDPTFLSSPPLTLDEEEEDEDRGGDCVTDGWEACSFCDDVFVMSVSACISSTLLSRLFKKDMLDCNSDVVKQKECEEKLVRRKYIKSFGAL